MSKTPDVIKKGLECCKEDECFGDRENCPYTADPRLCVGVMCADALALIQRLEAELADTKKAVGYTNGLCDICKHKNEHENECEANDFLCYNCPADCACKECYSDASHYEWRGVQKEERT